MVAIGLWTPYAKLESGVNLVMYDVYWFATQMMVTSYQIEIPGIYFQDRNYAQ